MRTRTKHPETGVRPFTVYLPPQLDRWLRCHAEQEGRTLTGAATLAVKAYRDLVERAGK